MMTAILPPSYALPRLDELTRPWTIPSWIATLYAELAVSDKLYNRCAAMGLAMNRFVPDTREELETYVDGNHEHELERRGTDWLMQQLPEDMKEVAHLAELEALNLVTEFDALEARNWPINDLVLLATAREMIECVSILLRRRGYASRVMPILDLLDKEAGKRLPFHKLAAPTFRPQLLIAVRGFSPKKWWGRVLGPMS